MAVSLWSHVQDAALCQPCHQATLDECVGTRGTFSHPCQQRLQVNKHKVPVPAGKQAECHQTTLGECVRHTLPAGKEASMGGLWLGVGMPCLLLDISNI